MKSKFRIFTVICLIIGGLITMVWGAFAGLELAGSVASFEDKNISNLFIASGIVSLLCAVLLYVFRSMPDVTVLISILYSIITITIIGLIFLVVAGVTAKQTNFPQLIEALILITIVMTNAYLSTTERK